MLYGGGWAEMRMARAIEEAAKKTPGVLAVGLCQVQSYVWGAGHCWMSAGFGERGGSSVESCVCRASLRRLINTV